MNELHFINKILLQSRSSFLIGKRFRGKINIQKPRAPHFERQLLIDLCQPNYGPPKYTIPEIKWCDKLKLKKKKGEIDNPFERILARECLDWFNNSKMIIFLHRNPISMEEKMPIFGTLAKNNMHLRGYGKKIVAMATKNTHYEVVNQLFTSHQDIIFGQPENAKLLLKILKKVPQLVVMAGIIDNRLMSKNELVQFSEYPSLDLARSQFCALLDSTGSHLVQHLNKSQQTLVAHLDKHIELQEADESKSISES